MITAILGVQHNPSVPCWARFSLSILEKIWNAILPLLSTECKYFRSFIMFYLFNYCIFTFLPTLKFSFTKFFLIIATKIIASLMTPNAGNWNCLICNISMLTTQPVYIFYCITYSTSNYLFIIISIQKLQP